MTKKEKDIRYYRTKKRMNDAMIELLKIKNFNQITVKDICEKATISRSGFYLHYMDKYDLVEKYQLELMKQINRIIDEETKRNASMEEIMIKILYFFKKEGLLLGLLLSNKGSVEIQNQVKKALQQNGLKNVLSYINYDLSN
ncbi:TetR/AcrR family transcriptional regulator [Enterococcus durans]|uniref:TetR/AcrR family transcriptional regulator n=1 Tax=Enterococcus durans TaxID=53345 RepID=UPI0021AEC4E5|nr:TetR/AcrR family transcriptional regulator [Enterococcus durans]